MRAALLLTGAEGCCVPALSRPPLTCTTASPNLMRGPCPACPAGAAARPSSKLMRCCPPAGVLPAPAVGAARGLAGSGREGAHGRLLSSWSLEVSVLASLSEEDAAAAQPAAAQQGSQIHGLTASITAGVSVLAVVHQHHKITFWASAVYFHCPLSASLPSLCKGFWRPDGDLCLHVVKARHDRMARRQRSPQ